MESDAPLILQLPTASVMLQSDAQHWPVLRTAARRSWTWLNRSLWSRLSFGALRGQWPGTGRRPVPLRL